VHKRIVVIAAFWADVSRNELRRLNSEVWARDSAAAPQLELWLLWCLFSGNDNMNTWQSAESLASKIFTLHSVSSRLPFLSAVGSKNTRNPVSFPQFRMVQAKTAKTFNGVLAFCFSWNETFFLFYFNFSFISWATKCFNKLTFS